ncbi:glycosyltransferase family 2 protein [Pseudomonas sp.]|uniref:glycosyltransferase family 2 protein n=1 Tax=Pseudomonas sp. TaxID=306 RepID=UPI0039C90243
MTGVVTEVSSVKKTAAANELNTLVVLTQDRPDFLRRTLQYYRHYAGPVLVLDSSTRANADLESRFPNVTYLHLPDLAESAAQEKLAYGVGRVTTPYMTFASDDDFLLQDALADSVEFLQAHSDYGFCHGYCLSYRSLGNQVDYFRRDKKVREDYDDERVQDRVLSAMDAFISPLHAVTRTQLLRHWYASLPLDVSAQWHTIGYAWYLLASAKGRILPIPYAVREAEGALALHKQALLAVLSSADPASRVARDRFAEFLASMSLVALGHDADAARNFVLESLAVLQASLHADSSAAHDLLIESNWKSPLVGPIRRFGPNQYVELPFYNQPFFDQLSEMEFLIGAIPAGAEQLHELEGTWVLQCQLMKQHDNDIAETVTERLWKALDLNVFNKEVVAQLAQQLEALDEPDESRGMNEWLKRLEAVCAVDRRSLLASTASGQLLDWIEAREPAAEDVIQAAVYLAGQGGGPQLGILLLDLDDDIDKLQVTLDSLLEGAYKGFKIVVFTTGVPPVATSLQNTLHFVQVSKSNYVDKLNQVARQTACDWLLLAQAGDQFLANSLLLAAVELQKAPQCRAVAFDEIQRHPHGALADVFRPAFNLDLLLRVPALLARHWLVRKDVFVQAGGYSADYTKALEFELLLRIIQTGGLAWLAHLDEPLLICDAPQLQENNEEQLALNHHLTALGYKAQISSALAGTYQIDYRHTERPLVSIILPSQGDLPTLQRCLTAVLQRTRYARYEVLIVDNHSQSPEIEAFLAHQEQQNNRIRVLRSEQHVSDAVLCNMAAQHARGEYLVILSCDAEVVHPNWLEALLNQAMRPEVGVVGAKLIDRQGKVTQAGLILGMNGGVGSAFIGEAKDATGYLHRLVVEQNYSAVSAACMMVRKELFDAVGGLDEGPFADAFSDVDLCLKIAQAGYLTVWTPHVHVIHPGTRPETPTALAALQAKWASAFDHDLAYNKNLSLSAKGFTLGEASSVKWAQLL